MEDLENDLKDSQDYSPSSFSRITKIIAASILVLFFGSFLLLSGFVVAYRLEYIVAAICGLVPKKLKTVLIASFVCEIVMRIIVVFNDSLNHFSHSYILSILNILACMLIAFVFFKVKNIFIRFNSAEPEQQVEIQSNNKLSRAGFIKNAPKKCWDFLKTQYRNPIFYLIIVIVILSISGIVLSVWVKNLEANLDYANGEINRAHSRIRDLEDKVEGIEDKLERVENVAHRHYW